VQLNPPACLPGQRPHAPLREHPVWLALTAA
jgi:hypothetical protein